MTRRSIQDWASIAEIIGAFAIVVSLMYVAFELRENNRILQVNSRQVLSDQDLRYFETALDPSVIAQALAKAQRNEPLSELEQSQLRQRQGLNFRIFEHAFFLFKNGALEIREWARYERIIQSNICNNEFAKQRWNRTSVTWDPDFQQIVNVKSQNCP